MKRPPDRSDPTEELPEPGGDAGSVSTSERLAPTLPDRPERLERLGSPGARPRPEIPAATEGPLSLQPVLEEVGSEQLPELRVAPAELATGERTPGQDVERADLLMGLVLGQGGMGVVYEAEQRPLGRPVAVKTLRPGGATPHGVRSLIREAVLTGRLEHPGIVPVHALGRDAHGTPLLVMKRVEGHPWRALLASEEHPAWESVSPVRNDRLEWHLRVLIQVCQAISLAHSRRIVHLDLKPDNVMIGRYGEVVLLDWGIALDLERPRKLAGGSVVGTPAYMAPEMAWGHLDLIDERTDVYLLGAMLHEVLNGRAPHTERTQEMMLARARAAAAPTFAPTLPAALVAIARRALSREPGGRFPSAAAFREALEGFLRDRSVLSLLDDATTRVERLGELCRAALAVPAAELTTAAAVAIYKLFGGCRYALEHAGAADVSPAVTDRARRSLDDCTALLAELELHRQNHAAAEILLAELSEPRPELAARLLAGRRSTDEQQGRLQELARLGQESDPRIGSRARALLALGLAVVFAGLFFGINRGARQLVGLQAGFLTALGMLVAVSIGLLVTHRLRSGPGNEAARRLGRMFLWAFLVLTLNHGLALWHTWTVPVVQAADLLVLTGILGTAALVADPRLWPSAAWFFSGAVLYSLVPERRGLHFVISLLGLVLVGLAWLKRRERRS